MVKEKLTRLWPCSLSLTYPDSFFGDYVNGDEDSRQWPIGTVIDGLMVCDCDGEMMFE